MTPVEHFRMVLHSLADGKPLPALSADWLLAGLAKHGKGEPLEVALMLTPTDRTKARNAALMVAADSLGAADSQWHRALLLQKAIARFESRVWPRLQLEAEPDLPPVDAALFQAFISGARKIRSARRLYDIIR